MGADELTSDPGSGTAPDQSTGSPAAAKPEKGRPPLRLTAAQQGGLLLLAVFSVFITWRAKSLEQTLSERRPVHELLSKTAPDFSLAALDARTISLANYKGKKKVVLSYWASWCLPCRAEMPELRDFYKRYHREDSDFEILAVSLDDDTKDAEDYATAEKLPFPVLLDPRGRVANSYSVDGIPTLFVIDKDGKVTYVQEGLQGGLSFVLMAQLGIPFPGSENQQGRRKE